MLICHIAVLLMDDETKATFEGYILPGGRIGKNLHYAKKYAFIIDGEHEGPQEIECHASPDQKESTAYLAKDVDPKFRIGFYGIRPR